MRFISISILSFVFAAALFWAGVEVQVRFGREKMNWAASTMAVKKEVVRNTAGRRLLIIGGSNALYGLSAEQMAEQVGIPAVNMAVSAGLDLDYLFHIIRRYGRGGDTILLMLEYEYYWRDLNTNENVIEFVLASDPEYYYELSLFERARMVYLLPLGNWFRGLSGLFGSQSIVPWQIEAVLSLGPRGDFGANDEDRWTEQMRASVATARKSMEWEARRGRRLPDDEQFERLSRIISWCRSKNMNIVATWPVSLWSSAYKEHANTVTFEAISSFYRAQNVRVLADWRDAMFDRQDFVDSINHLTARARSRHTAMIASEFVQWKVESSGANQ